MRGNQEGDTKILTVKDDEGREGQDFSGSWAHFFRLDVEPWALGKGFIGGCKR